MYVRMCSCVCVWFKISFFSATYRQCAHARANLEKKHCTSTLRMFFSSPLCYIFPMMSCISSSLSLHMFGHSLRSRWTMNPRLLSSSTQNEVNSGRYPLTASSCRDRMSSCSARHTFLASMGGRRGGFFVFCVVVVVEAAVAELVYDGVFRLDWICCSSSASCCCGVISSSSSAVLLWLGIVVIAVGYCCCCDCCNEDGDGDDDDDVVLICVTCIQYEKQKRTPLQ